MYSFEGEYRRRPEQLLAGHSVNRGRDQLLLHAQQQRQLRRQRELQAAAAVRVQAFVRGCLARAGLRRELRRQFDELLARISTDSAPSSAECVARLIRQLVRLYHDGADDRRRMIAVGQLVLRHEQLRCRLRTQYDATYCSLLALVTCTLSSPLDEPQLNVSLAVPLRLLEDFVSLTMARATAASFLPRLMKAGYWSHLRRLIDRRLPELDEDWCRAPVPLADSLLTLIVRPLMMMKNHDITATILTPFLSQLLAAPLSSQVRHFVLPALVASEALSLPSLIHCIDTERRSMQCAITPGLWLLYVLLRLCSSTGRDRLSRADSVVYVCLLDWCACHADVKLSSSDGSFSGLPVDSDSEPDEYEDDDDEDDEADNMATEHYQHHVLSDTLQLLNSSSHVHWLKSLIDSECSSATCHCSAETSASHADSRSDTDGWVSCSTSPDVLSSCTSSASPAEVFSASTSTNSSVVVGVCGVCYYLLKSERLALHRHMLLYTLAFSRRFLLRLWRTVESCSRAAPALITDDRSLLLLMARGVALEPHERHRVVPLLVTFCAMSTHMLVTLQDSELSATSAILSGQHVHEDGGSLFSLAGLISVSAVLRDVFLGLVELAYPDVHHQMPDSYSTALFDMRREQGRAGDKHPSSSSSSAAAADWLFLLQHVSTLLWHLHSRDSRLHFCPAGHWSCRLQPLPAERVSQVARLFRAGSTAAAVRRQFVPFAGRQVRAGRDHLAPSGGAVGARDVRTLLLLRRLPFVLSFRQRVLLFQELLRQERASWQSERDHFMSEAGVGAGGRGGNAISITVRRNYLYEDAFEKLSMANEPTLKPRMRVAMINAKGLDEPGIDGGGIFREFLSELLRTAFDPNRGFFCVTQGQERQQQLYPNPQVGMLVEDPATHYHFIGRALGKAIYEQLQVELPMAAFFLVKLLGRRCEKVDLHYLQSLDPELHRHLMFVCSGQYAGDLCELGLDFSVHVSQLGTGRVVELKPGGASIAVTADNCIEYVHLMADFKLNRQIERQCSALRAGLAEVVPLHWLQMFDHNELQTLVSGAPVPVNVDDLRAHTNYSGGYSASHAVIVNFWRVVDEMHEQHRCQLLRFVTACSRPPLLGFSELNPAFCVHSAGAEDRDEHRLPSASTCMNLLKLPEYKTLQLLRDKLIYAIEAEPGFELS